MPVPGGFRHDVCICTDIVWEKPGTLSGKWEDYKGKRAAGRKEHKKNTNTTGTKEQWEAQGNGLDSGLARTLGLTQSTWEEDVSSKGADQYLDAKIRIPEAGSLSTIWKET